MRKTAVLLVALVLMAIAGAAGAVEYAVPCYEWNCTEGAYGYCEFDAECSGSGGVWAYSWAYGDGTGDSWLTTPETDHYYSTGAYANVTLTLTFFGKGDEDTTCLVQYRNLVGPPDDLIGDCGAPTPDGCDCP